jgi:hypothetical protein
MDAKIIAALSVLALVAVAAFYTVSPLVTNRASPNVVPTPTPTPTPTPMPSPSPSPATPPSTLSPNDAALSSVVNEEYSNLIQDELNKMSIDQPSFNSQVQDSVASDLSQFYYS